MTEGLRTLNADERRLIAEALLRSASDTWTLRNVWSESGAVGKTLLKKGMADEERREYVDHLSRIIHAQERLAAEIKNPNYEIAIIAKEQ